MCAIRGIDAWLVVLLLWAAPGLGAAGLAGGHLSRSDCASCHAAGNNVTGTQAARLIASQESLCVRCHPRAVQQSHPTGIVPLARVPTEYPLDWKGELTCSTCHLVHGSEPGLMRGSKRARAFCQSCHDAGFFARMKDSGTSLVISGHLDVGRGTIDIDAHSLHCLGCHASSHAGGGSVSIGRNGVLRHGSGSAPHPIGRNYSEAGRRGGYHPEHMLAQKKITLSDGKVSCLSCHEAYKKEHGRLVLPMDRSALCLACHAK